MEYPQGFHSQVFPQKDILARPNSSWASAFLMSLLCARRCLDLYIPPRHPVTTFTFCTIFFTSVFWPSLLAPVSMQASWCFHLNSLLIRMDCSGPWGRRSSLSNNQLSCTPLTSGACPMELFQADSQRGHRLLIPGCSVPPADIGVAEPPPWAGLKNMRLLPALCRQSHPCDWWDWEHKAVQS